MQTDSKTGKSVLLFPEGIVELNETAREILVRCALMHGVHQSPANCAILHGWVDRNRPDTSDAVAFVEKIAADHPTVDFRNHRIKFRIFEQRR